MREAEEDFAQREIDNTLALLVDTRSWIQRRTDRIELLDTYTIRRSITFEIELPEWGLDALDSPDCRLILPIGIFGGGQVLRNLEITFGQEPAGTLTRAAGERLTALLRERLKKNGDLGIPHETRQFLDELLEIDVQEEDGPGRLGRGALENGNYILFVTSDKSLGGVQAGGSRFVVTVATDQTLVRRLPPERQPASIRQTLRAIGLGRVAEEPKNAERPLERAWRWTASKVRDFRSKARGGIMPSDTAFVVAQVISGFGDARSWQMEIYAPDELRISDGALIWWGPDQEELPPDPAGDQQQPPQVMNGHAPATRRGTSAVALTRFRVQADSIRHIGLLVTYATIVLLGVAIGIALSGGSGPIVDAVVAVLVIAPSLGASIVTNPESHEMAGDYLKPLRQRIYLVGFLAALAAAFFIIFGLSQGDPVDPFCAGQAASSLTPEQLQSCADNLSWTRWSSLSFGLMVISFLGLLWVALSFHWQQLDINRRNRLSGRLLTQEEDDSREPRLKVYEESTNDERIRRGLWGRKRSILNSRPRKEKDSPLKTISSDPIDLGPRAIFRMPSPEDEAKEPMDKRVQEGTLERPYKVSRAERKEAQNRVPGLFDRFFYGTWVGNEPPPWFFWSSDIEADYITEPPKDETSEVEAGQGGEE